MNSLESKYILNKNLIFCNRFIIVLDPVELALHFLVLPFDSKELANYSINTPQNLFVIQALVYLSHMTKVILNTVD